LGEGAATGALPGPEFDHLLGLTPGRVKLPQALEAARRLGS
jgi:hypothetical protein